MAGLFDGTDDVICRSLGISNRKDLSRKTTSIKPISDEESSGLVNGLYDRITCNYPGRIVSRSKKLWRCRRETDIGDCNQNSETVLEKAVATLAENGHMPAWFNQCPVASGIADPSSDRNRAVDLVHLSDGDARLIELKWGSDAPCYALFEVLEYGLAYIFSRVRKKEFGLEEQRLMHVRHVALEVVAPLSFFAGHDLRDFFARMSKSLKEFAVSQTGGALSMSLYALAFPKEFNHVPFKDGKSVKKKCRTDELTAEGRKVRDAFDRLTPVWTTQQGK